MTATLTPTPRALTPIVGPRTELGRYTLPDGRCRLLIGQRVNCVVRVSDVPASDTGRRYLVERELTSNAELQALVADYLAESERRGEPAITAPSYPISVPS